MKQNKGFSELCRAVEQFEKKGRAHLPWRGRQTPYAVFLSELMLQQTQVERVIGKYDAFLARFPSWKELARASLQDVLTLWVGLGYNRRARNLHEAARIVMSRFGGTLPHDPSLIEELPGVGPYTAAAVAAFAFNAPTVFVETNIRTVFIHHCFKNRKKVNDAELAPLVVQSLKGREPRQWYAALMDYGAHLKRHGVRLNTKSAHYARQKKFEGSTRQLRGALIRLALKGPLSLEGAAKRVGRTLQDVEREAERLAREGLLSFKGGMLSGSR